jgi:predicted nucleotidyltransferase
MNKKIYESLVLELFFDDPEGAFHIREIARQIRKHPNTVLKDANLLVKEGLLLKRVTRAVVEIKANRESELFTCLKRLSNLRKVYLSGIIDAIQKEYGAPKAIVLFGSYSRGEDTKRSDVDIAVITTRELHLDWSGYRDTFKRAIQVHEIDLQKVGKSFITNLANGIVLKGYLDI